MPPARKVKPRSKELAALGQAVREIREQKGLTMEALAERADTDLRQLGGIERGTRNPSYEFLHRLALGLESSVGEITTRADHLRRDVKSQDQNV